MNTGLDSMVGCFSQLRAAVIGEAILDQYASGQARRLCRESPVPVIDIGEEYEVPGGGANTAANLRSLGAHTKLISAVGDDAAADRLTDMLRRRGVDVGAIQVIPGRRTLAKQRIVAGAQMVVRADRGTRGPLAADDQRRLVAALDEVLSSVDLLVVSDYGYGIVSQLVLARLARWSHTAARVLAVDSKRLDRFRPLRPTAVKPNFEEALRLLRRLPDSLGARRDQFIAAQGARILRRTGARIAAVTLDRDGAMVFQRGSAPHRTRPSEGGGFHTAGAGDTFLAALGLSLAAGATAPQAAEIAAAAANLVVTLPRTAACNQFELQSKLTGLAETSDDWTGLRRMVAEARQHGRRIVLTNGCFDILHRGHVALLHQARRLGDLLIVGVNSDASVRRLKGPARPINPLLDRLGVLRALSCVDCVAAFDEDTPQRLIEAVRPDVYVKGGDYCRQTLPETELVERLGGEVRILPLVEERSTTCIIQRIRAGGMPPLAWSSSLETPVGERNLEPR